MAVLIKVHAPHLIWEIEIPRRYEFDCGDQGKSSYTAYNVRKRGNIAQNLTGKLNLRRGSCIEVREKVGIFLLEKRSERGVGLQIYSRK